MAVKENEKPGSIEMEEVALREGVHSCEDKADYSGAVAKTDAAEIALCRKLDRRVLPILWAMYYLYVMRSL